MTTRTVLVAHPSADLYGADLQLLQSVAAMVASGRRVVVAVPAAGPLCDRIRAVGAEIEIIEFPVLRKADLRPASLAGTAWSALAALPRIRRLLKRLAPELVYVNTVTLPWWLMAARSAGVLVVCHLHEAETGVHPWVGRIMMAPLHLATKIIVISRAARSAMLTAQPGLAERAELIYNGVPGPDQEPEPVQHGGRTRLIVVGRLSPRKAPHLALDAVGLLITAGYDVEIELAGSVFASYESYETELRQRAAQPDLAGRVIFSGHRTPIWPALAEADIVVQPSAQEPFGNAVVEGMLALRPVVATDALGHQESLRDGETGLLVADVDAHRLAEAIRSLIDRPAVADELASAGRWAAQVRFSTARYRAEITDLLDRMITAEPAPADSPAKIIEHDRQRALST